MPYDNNDIIILGDSFCSFRDDPTDWPVIISSKLSNTTSSPRGVGFRGASWWSTRNRLIKELEVAVPKILILCHTEPNRVPSDYDYGINGMTVRSTATKFPNDNNLDDFKQREIIKAGSLYYRELWSVNFHSWAQLAWFKELDELLDKYAVPCVIHLRCFDWTVDYVFKNGITIEETLFDFSVLDDTVNHHYFRNHFTTEMNETIGKTLLNIIENYDANTGLVKLNLPKNTPVLK